MKSFIKYAGSKARLAEQIIDSFPDSFNNYFEPFLGGGSIFLNFSVDDSKKRKYFLSDLSFSLMNCWHTVKNHPNELIRELKKTKYVNLSETFYKNRVLFNKVKDYNSIENAALFIYLNKCCFNGLYQENKKGEFNVSFGKMHNPTILNEELLLQINNLLNLKNTSIEHHGYSDILKKCKPGDLVYLDPPYHGTFTKYVSEGFNEDNQVELKNFVETLTRKNVFVIQSNAKTPFIKNLYKGYSVKTIKVKYSISNKGQNRGDERQEYLIKNY